MNDKLTSLTYVVFDLETTGLYPNSGDSITEFGAVKIKDGKIIDRYDELINPGKDLSEEIIKITGINTRIKAIANEIRRGTKVGMPVTAFTPVPQAT